MEKNDIRRETASSLYGEEEQNNSFYDAERRTDGTFIVVLQCAGIAAALLVVLLEAGELLPRVGFGHILTSFHRVYPLCPLSVPQLWH